MWILKYSSKTITVPNFVWIFLCVTISCEIVNGLWQLLQDMLKLWLYLFGN